MDTRTVFALRKEGKIQEALNMALKLYEIDSADNWIQSALAWPLIDLCKAALKENSLNQAQKYFNQLIAINFTDIDDILKSQIAFLRPKIDINYTKIQEAENLSKNGNHKQALINLKAMFSNNQLLDIHHEAYGWVIYRYIKAEENNVSSVEIRSLMRDYMNLKNERPSMVHSVFLNFALHFSKEHSDFKLYSFFLLWDPKNLRHDDLNNNYKDEKKYPSLISRIFREFIDKKVQIDLGDLCTKIPSLSPAKITELLREPFYWNIYAAEKENRKEDVWKILQEYNSFFKNQTGSVLHSKILNSAMFSMKENEEWRFLNFFENWNPENFIESDWKEVVVQDNSSFNFTDIQNVVNLYNQIPDFDLNIEIHKNTDFSENARERKTFKPIALKALKKAFELIKVSKQTPILIKFINAYKLAVLKFPNDVWLKREYAILLAKNNEFEEAIKNYKSIVLELGDQAYAWHEFALLFTDNNLEIAIGMLSKAIVLQKDESFLGDIRLDLADKLVKSNFLEEGLVELNIYAKNRELKGWKLPEKYNDILSSFNVTKTQKLDNNILYREKIKLAEDFAYQDIIWSELVFTEKWENDKNREKLNFTDGNLINLSISKSRFLIFKSIVVGDVIKVKLYNKLVADKNKLNHFKQDYTPLIVEKSAKTKWCILDDLVAIVDYINDEKKTIHAISSDNVELFFPVSTLSVVKGDFLKAKKFKKYFKDEIRIEIRNISKCSKNEVIEKFTQHLAVVDSVNVNKKLFHFVVNSTIQGVIRFNEVKIIPKEGDFLQLRLVNKFDKRKNTIFYKQLDVKTTAETTTTLRKEISGLLKLKYRNYGSTLDYEELDYDDQLDLKPDFGFIDDYYVTKEILVNKKIIKPCVVDAKVVSTGGKWKVFDLIKRTID